MTADHLGSPRIITNENGAVISRHDYSGFGVDVAEKYGNIGGRSSTQGYGTDDKVRQQYTGYQHDDESGLEYAQARNYNSAPGRFTSVDPLMASANVKNPQTFNRYSYVLNSPYKFVDPLGLISSSTGACGMCGNEDLYVDGSAFRGRDSSFDWAKQSSPPPPPPQKTIDITKDPKIQKRIAEIKEKAKPLPKGVAPLPTTAEMIVGTPTQLNGDTVVGDGQVVDPKVTGYMNPIAVVVLDQGGNIIVAPDDMFIVEKITADSADAKTLEKEGRLITTIGQEVGQASDGVFYDPMLRGTGANSYNIVTTQDVTIRHYFGPKATDYKEIFKITGTQIVKDDAKRSATITPGKISKIN